MPPSSRRGRPAKAASAGLSLPAICRASLALVDAEGLSALTMRRLGKALGVDPMAIYHYLPNKAALLDNLIEAVWMEFDLPTAWGERSLAEGLVLAARQYRQTILRHPNTLPLLSSRPSMTPGALAKIEGLVGFMVRYGLEIEEAITAVNVVSAWVVGTLWSQSPPNAFQAPRPVGLPPGMENVAPLLTTQAKAGVDPHHERTFEAGLSWLVAGIIAPTKGLAR